MKNFVPVIEIDDSAWYAQRELPPLNGQEALYARLIIELVAVRPLTEKRYRHLMGKYARQGLPWLGKEKLQRILAICATPVCSPLTLMCRWCCR